MSETFYEYSLTPKKSQENSKDLISKPTVTSGHAVTLSTVIPMPDKPFP